MDKKTVAVIAVVAIAVLIFKPDLLSNLFKNAQQSGGGGGSDMVIVPPVISQPSHSTYYDVDVGAPTFPEPHPMFEDPPASISKPPTQHYGGQHTYMPPSNKPDYQLELTPEQTESLQGEMGLIDLMHQGGL